MTKRRRDEQSNAAWIDAPWIDLLEAERSLRPKPEEPAADSEVLREWWQTIAAICFRYRRAASTKEALGPFPDDLAVTIGRMGFDLAGGVIPPLIAGVRAKGRVRETSIQQRAISLLSHIF